LNGTQIYLVVDSGIAPIDTTAADTSHTLWHSTRIATSVIGIFSVAGYFPSEATRAQNTLNGIFLSTIGFG
jgi:hypothetical protein